MFDDTDREPHHASSPTDHVLTELQLFGYRPIAGELDPRPLPDDNDIASAVIEIFAILSGTFADTCLDADLEDLLWSLTNSFHRTADRISRKLDTNEQAQRRSQLDQDGSEVRSVELERLIAEGQLLFDRRDALEHMRDLAADRFEQHTGSSWKPRAGSLISHKALTATVIDSRDYLAARKRAETEPLLPTGPKIVVTGGMDFGDVDLIWSVLDKVRLKHKDMVLVHGKSTKGAEFIAAKWADSRGVTQIGFAPDWAKHGRAAPFRRNDVMLDILPTGVIVFPGNGIQANLADKAKALGIPVWRFGER